MNTYKLQFIRAIHCTKFTNTHLLRDVVTKNYMIAVYYSKSVSFYPSDKMGKRLPIKKLAALY